MNPDKSVKAHKDERITAVTRSWMTSTRSRSSWRIRMWAVALTNSWGKHGKPLMVIHALPQEAFFFPLHYACFLFFPFPERRDPIARDQRRLVDPREASIRSRAAGTLLCQQSHALRSRNNHLSFCNSHHLQASDVIIRRALYVQIWNLSSLSSVGFESQTEGFSFLFEGIPPPCHRQCWFSSYF